MYAEVSVTSVWKREKYKDDQTIGEERVLFVLAIRTN